MKNPHIVIREDGGCLCGQYTIPPFRAFQNVSCKDVIDALDQLGGNNPKENFGDNIKLVRSVIMSHVKECD